MENEMIALDTVGNFLGYKFSGNGPKFVLVSSAIF